VADFIFSFAQTALSTGGSLIGSEKQKTLALGVYRTVTLAEARQTREKAKRQLVAGLDPGEARKQSKRIAKLSTENTFASIAREVAKKQGNRWSQRHSENYLRRLGTDIFTTIGTRPIASINAPEMLQTLPDLSDRP
jgi:hypothetical protein